MPAFQKPEVDPKREVPVKMVKSLRFECDEPGRTVKVKDGILNFACPGCGHTAHGIRVGVEKPAEGPSWQITEGNPDDPTTLSLIPSILCKGCCEWHGYLTKGVFKPC